MVYGAASARRGDSVMSETQVNAQDVLKQYAQVLQDDEGGHDAGALPFPKPVIKATLAHFLEVSTDAEIVGWLHGAFMKLADFQDLSEDERSALAWKADPQTSEPAETEHHTKIYLALKARISSEAGALQREASSLRS